MPTDWLPRDADALALWLQNFSQHSADLTTQLSIPAAQVTAVTDLGTDWLNAHEQVASLKGALAAAVQAQATALDTLTAPLRALVRQAKASPASTPALLELLELQGSSNPVTSRVEAEKPVLTLSQGAAVI